MLLQNHIKKENYPIQISGLLFFGFQLFLAVLYYKERMINTDNAFYSFKIIQYGDYMTEGPRKIHWITQSLPLLALKLGCSIKTFLRLYSASFVLLYYLAFLYVTLFLKNNKAGIVMLLSLCLCFRHVFYYPVAELQSGIVCCVMLWAYISREEYYSLPLKRIATWFSLLILFALCFICHPLTVFLVAFLLLMESAEDNKWKNPCLFIPMLFVGLLYIVRFFFVQVSDYETNHLIGLNTILGVDIYKLLHEPSTQYIINFISTQLKTALLLMAITIALLIYLKRWAVLVLHILFSFGFFVLVVIYFQKGDSPLFLQSYFVAHGFFIALPLISSVKNKTRETRSLFIVSPFILFSLFSIYQCKSVLTKKIQYISRMTEYGKSFPEKRYLLEDKNYLWQVAWTRWTFPFETFLYSAMQNPDSAVTYFVSDNLSKYDSLMQDKTVFLGPEWDAYMFNYPANKLNKKYFRLPDLGYRKINTAQTDSIVMDSLLNNQAVKLYPLMESIKSDMDLFVIMPFVIENKSGKVIPSFRQAANSISLSYHIYDSDGKQIVWDGYRTPFDVDIDKKFTQGLVVNIPEEKGTYIVEADIITEGIKWWGINSRFKLIVK